MTSPEPSHYFALYPVLQYITYFKWIFFIFAANESWTLYRLYNISYNGFQKTPIIKVLSRLFLSLTILFIWTMTINLAGFANNLLYGILTTFFFIPTLPVIYYIKRFGEETMRDQVNEKLAQVNVEKLPIEKAL